MNMFIQIVEPVQESNHVHYRDELVCSFCTVRERGRIGELVSGK